MPTSDASRDGTGSGLALFDFDGTLTRVETFPLFVRFAAPRWRVWFGGLLLAPLVLAYRRGLVSGTTIRAAIVRVAFAGMPTAHFEAGCREFADTVLPGLIRPEALDWLRCHRDRGDRLVVVSGNFEALLRPWCDAQGLQLLASSLEASGDRLTGRYAGDQCAGTVKARRVRERFPDVPREAITAYGDTPEDFAMLALAGQTVFLGAGRR